MVSDLSPAVVASAAIVAIGLPLQRLRHRARAGLVRCLVPVRMQPRRWRVVPSTSTS
jgi:hypothetical protein